MKALVCALTVGSLALLQMGCIFEDSARFKEDFQYSYSLAPNGRVSVENTNGSIEIAGWDKDSIEIRGTKWASSEEGLKEIKIDITESHDAVSVRTRAPSGWHGGVRADYVIHVPRQSQLERIASSNGSIRVDDISGEVRLRTTNGSITAGNVRGRLSVETSNGRIKGADLEGDCYLTTSNGSIQIDRVRGGVEARTTNGTITLTLPPDIKASVQAKTTHGTVSSDFEELARSSSRRNKLDGTIGGGGPLIRLSTTNGSIRLRKG